MSGDWDEFLGESSGSESEKPVAAHGEPDAQGTGRGPDYPVSDVSDLDLGDSVEPESGGTPDVKRAAAPTYLLIVAGVLSVLALLAGLAAQSVVVNAIGYVLGGFVAVTLVFVFRQRTAVLRATSRHYFPSPRRDQIGLGLMVFAFSTGVLNAVRLAWAIATDLALKVIIITAIGSLVFASLVVAPAASQESGVSSAAEVFDDFVACVSGGNPGLVLILVDESGSLSKTDPNDGRVAGIQSTLESLGAVVAAIPDAEVEVQLAGFSVDFEQRSSWTLLDDSSLVELQVIAREYAELDHGLDTDYFLALNGAYNSIESEADKMLARDGAKACKSLYWFTDGVYDVEDRKDDSYRKPYAPDLDLSQPGAGAQAEAIGTERLCERGGVADLLRNVGTTQVAVTLTSESVSSDDYALVTAIAEGRSGALQCGVEAANGVVEDIQNPDSLNLVRIGTEIVVAPMPAPPCTGGSCILAIETFDLDSLTSSVWMDISEEGGNLGEVTVDIVAPSGVKESLEQPQVSSDGIYQIESRTTSLDGHDLRWKWFSGRRINAGLSVDQSRSAGTWQVVFTGPASLAETFDQEMTVSVIPGYDLELTSIEALQAGESGMIGLTVVGKEGEPFPPEGLERVQIAAVWNAGGSLAPTDIQLEATQSGELVGPITLPLDFEASEIEVVATVAPIDTDTGLAPIQRSFSVSVLPPAGFGQLVDVIAEPVSGTDTEPVQIVVKPDAGVGGCVWLELVEITSVPIQLEGESVTIAANPSTKADCVPLAAGGPAIVLAQDLSVPRPGRGTVTGSVVAVFTAYDSDRVVRQSRDFEFAMGVDPEPPYVLIAVLVLLSAALPLGFMMVLKRRQARYSQTGKLRRLEAHVVVDDGGVRLAVTGRDELGHLSALEEGNDWLSESREPPQSSVGFAFGRHLGLNPFTPAKAVATHPRASLVVGSSGYRLARRKGWPGTPTGLLEFSLREEWAVALTDLEPLDGQDGPESDQDQRPDRATGVLVAFFQDSVELERVLADLETETLAAFKSVDWKQIRSVLRDRDSAPSSKAKKSPPTPTDPGVPGLPPLPDDDDDLSGVTSQEGFDPLPDPDGSNTHGGSVESATSPSRSAGDLDGEPDDLISDIENWDLDDE